MKENFYNILNTQDLHYHKTSLDALDKIMRQGILLSEFDIRGEGHGSVFLTKDFFSPSGFLIEMGCNETGLSGGAASNEVTMVFNDKIINDSSYFVASESTIIDHIDIEGNLIAVLGRDTSITNKVKDILMKNCAEDIIALDLDIFRQIRYSNLNSKFANNELSIPDLDSFDSQRKGL